MSLLLGIDGGGSKTEAAIADLNGNILQKARVEKGSNPWEVGIGPAIDVVGEVLTQLTQIKDVTACFAGISGCAAESDFSQQFSKTLAQKVAPGARVAVAGDLLTSFRSSASSPYGQIAIAGSGSAISHFYPNGGRHSYDSVSFGGRDIAMSLILAGASGQFSSATTKWLEAQISKKLATFTNLQNFYSVESVTELAKQACELPQENSVAKEIRPYLLQAAYRWAYKIWGGGQKFRTSAGWAKDAGVETVLSGGTWRSNLIRNEVIRLVGVSDPHLAVIYNPDKSPLDGAITLAKELANHTN